MPTKKPKPEDLDEDQRATNRAIARELMDRARLHLWHRPPNDVHAAELLERAARFLRGTETE